MWSGGATASWTSRAQATAQNASGIGNYPNELVQDQRASIEQVLYQAPRSTHTLSMRMAMLGAVHGWRTCNTQQMAALTGNGDMAKPTSKVAAAFFSAGLVDLANPSQTRRGAPIHNVDSAAAVRGSRFFGVDSIFRPGRVEAFRLLADRLTWAEWIAVTGGQPWAPGGLHDRHNLLATELGLRLAEYAEIGTVLGERFSTVDLLTGSGVGRAPVVGDQRAADMTVVRPDGLRIAVELTASISPHFDRKVERWVELLAYSPFELTGLSVIFLVAQPLEDADASKFRNRTYQAVMRAVRKHPGVSLDPTALRVGVASWREWFPSSHTVSEAFLTMRAHRPVDGWSDADFLDPTSMRFKPKYPAKLLGVIDNASMLGQTPHWLRRPDRVPTLTRELLAAHGLNDVPPFHTGSPRAKNKIVHPLDERGITGVPGLPTRLRGLAG